MQEVHGSLTATKHEKGELMAGYNCITIVGNLTKEVDARETSGGTTVANFSVAVNERVKKGGEWQDHVEYFDVVFFGKLGEVARDFLGRGKQVMVVGTIRTEKYEKDGQERKAVKVYGDKLVMLGSKGDAKGGGSGGAPRDEPVFNADDEIPFKSGPSFYDHR